MKTLHLLHSFPPASRGGVETYVRELARAQSRAGDEPLVLAGSDAGEPASGLREEQVDGLRVFRLRPTPRSGRNLEGVDPEARRFLEEMIRRERPEVLHVHHWHNVTSDAVEAAAAAGVPAVVTVHDFFPTCPLFFRLPDDEHPCPPTLERAACVRCYGRFLGPPDLLERSFAGRERRYRAELEGAHEALAISETQRDFLSRIPWLQGVRLSLLPLPRPFLPGARLRPRDPEPALDLRAVSWGGLVPGKGLHTLVEACEGLPRPERIAIDHYGRVLEPVYEERLRSVARRVRLRLHGAYGLEEVVSAFPAHDVAVFPSFFFETHGYVVDEALEIGLPVVVSDRGAPHLRIGSRGVVFPAGDAAALRGILAGFIEDPASLARLRAGEPEPGVRMEEHRAALAGIYAEAAARPPSRRRGGAGGAP